MKNVISLISSYEFVFVLFLQAAEFEAIPLFAPLANSIRFIFIFWSLNFFQLLFILYRRYHKYGLRVYTIRLLYFSVFILVLSHILLSHILTPDDPNSTKKVLEFSTIISWCFFSGTFIITNRTRAQRFVVAFGAFAVGIAITSTYNLLTGGIGLRELTGGVSEGYHRLGRSTGALIVTCVVGLPHIEAKRKRLGVLLILVIAVAGLISSGQRAPWLAFPVAFTALYLFHTARDYNWSIALTKQYLAKGMLLAIVILLGGLFWTERGQYVVERFESISLSTAENERIYLYKKAYEEITENPVLGIGFGRFSRETGLENNRHPHNLFMETYLELGVIGFVSIITLIFAWVLPGFRRSVNLHWATIALAGMFWFYLMNTMISGSITDNRELLSMGAILFAIRVTHSRNINT